MSMLTSKDLGAHVPRRHGNIGARLASVFNRLTGWRTVGTVPDIRQAVIIGAPHTSNFDGVFTLPLLIALDLSLIHI